jgi:hypothetical protein
MQDFGIDVGRRVTKTRGPSKNDLHGPNNNYAVRSPASATPTNFGIIGFTAHAKGGNAPSRGVSYGGGGGGTSYGGGGVGSNRSGAISHAIAPAPPPAPPAPPSLAAFSAKDSTYQNQLAALKKALADYKAQQGQSQTQYLTNYGTDVNTLKENRTQGLGDLENDYASRGLLQSGLYADSLSDLNKDFDTRQSQLDQAKAAYLAQLANDATNFQSEQQLTQQKALQEAAARRAAQYNL